MSKKLVQVLFIIGSFFSTIGTFGQDFQIDLSDCRNYPLSKPQNINCKRGGDSELEENFALSSDKAPTFNKDYNSLMIEPGSEILIYNDKIDELIQSGTYTISFVLDFPDPSDSQPWNFMIKLNDNNDQALQIVWDPYNENNTYKLYYGFSIVGIKAQNRPKNPEDKPFDLETIRYSNDHTLKVVVEQNVLKKIIFNTKELYDSSSDGGVSNLTVKQFKIQSFFADFGDEFKKAAKQMRLSKNIEAATMSLKRLLITDYKPNNTSISDNNSISSSNELVSQIQNKNIKFSVFSIANSKYAETNSYDSKSELGNSPKMDQDSLNKFFKKTGLINSTNFFSRNELKTTQMSNLSSLFPVEKLGDINFIHFSGHGNSFNNKNYWLPIDYKPREVKERLAQIKNPQNSSGSSLSENTFNQYDNYLNNQALSVERLISFLDTLNGGKRIYFILSDACRDPITRGDEKTGVDFSSINFNQMGVILNSNDSSQLSNHSLFLIGFPVAKGDQTANYNTFTQQLILNWNNDNNFWDYHIDKMFSLDWISQDMTKSSDTKICNSIPELYSINKKFKNIHEYFIENSYFKRP